MKGILQFILVFLIAILSGFNCANQTKKVSATLTKSNGNDSILNSITLSDSSIFDLKHCIENFGYPGNIPLNIYWIKPDTSGMTSLEKENIVFKYIFDTDNKLITYYYQGSKISGIFPLPYFFLYDINKPELITQISDVFYRTKYLIKYDNDNNIEMIEKLDSLNNKIEVLTIKIK
jgi:hypothetical protein